MLKKYRDLKTVNSILRFALSAFVTVITVTLFTLQFIGCEGNSVAVNTNTTQGNVNSSEYTAAQLRQTGIAGFGAINGTFLASTYCSTCCEAYLNYSTDNGNTWMQTGKFHVYNSTPTNKLYYALPTTFITDGSTVLGGVGNVPRGAIYKSTDEGRHWSGDGITWPEVDSNMTEAINCFYPCQGNILAGTAHGIFVSADHGNTWTAANDGLIYTADGKGCPVNAIVSAGTSLFASSSFAGLYRSDDSAKSWKSVYKVTGTMQGVAVIGSKIFTCVCQNTSDASTGGVFVSSDNGVTWQRSDSGIGDHYINVIYSYNNYLFAGTAKGVYASLDTGKTWSAIYTGTTSTTKLFVFNSCLYSDGNVYAFALSRLTAAMK